MRIFYVFDLSGEFENAECKTRHIHLALISVFRMSETFQIHRKTQIKKSVEGFPSDLGVGLAHFFGSFFSWLSRQSEQDATFLTVTDSHPHFLTVESCSGLSDSFPSLHSLSQASWSPFQAPYNMFPAPPPLPTQPVDVSITPS